MISTLSRNIALRNSGFGNAVCRTFSASSLDTIGSHQFSDDKLKAAVSEGTYAAFRESNRGGASLGKAERNEIAKAMANFAIGLGATNFCHKFYPLRYHDGRANAGGKLNTFLDLDYGHPDTLKPIVAGADTFDGGKLFFSETDGSSFPNGGMRDTHTAAAYMSWDKTSPPYVRKGTLYIPSAFMTYYGDALDHKTPLLRSQEAINREGVRLLRHLGDTTAQQVVSNVGCEQEYFLVDRDHYNARPDLVMSGRMLFGSVSEREQEGCEQYFGPPSVRARAFMDSVAGELTQQGISMNVYHNEVAPSQHELCPVFCLTNVAADQNVLTMEIMSEVAAAQGLAVLFHEKPFAGVNGSGKHSNWGLNTDSGKNLFKPGKSEESQVDFIACVAALAHALNNHGDLLRCGVACAGNDHRLGAQEAPPAIVSLYTGLHLEEHLSNIANNGGDLAGYGDSAKEKQLSFGTNAVEDVPASAEDRNRTAPFPFCGNRFEFRAVGSSQNVALPLTFVNTAVAAGFAALSDKIEGGLGTRDAVAEMLQENFPVIFNGDGYSAEWVEEAEQRGLPNLNNATKALATLDSEKNKKIFSDTKVLQPHELEARKDVMLGEIAITLLIEARTSLRMVDSGYVPAFLADLKQYQDVEFDAGSRRSVYESVQEQAGVLRGAIDAYPHDGSAQEQAEYASDTLRPTMASLRESVDEAELLCDASLVPYHGYQNILFDHQSQS